MLLSALHIDYPRQVVTLSTTIMEGHRAAEPIMDLVTTFALLVSAFSLVSTKHTAELPHRLTKIHKKCLPILIIQNIAMNTFKIHQTRLKSY